MSEHSSRLPPAASLLSEPVVVTIPNDDAGSSGQGNDAHDAETTHRRFTWRSCTAWMNDPHVKIAGGILGFGGMVGAIVALVLGYQPLHAHAGNLRQARTQVVIEWPAIDGNSGGHANLPGQPPRTWVNAEIREALTTLVERNIHDNPLDADGIEAARSSLARTGWIKDDLQVYRSPGGLVRVSGTWRVPVAAVRHDGLDRLVSAAGELLPLSYDPNTSKLKVIVGAAHAPPEYGQAWLGGDVQEGLKLLLALQNQEFARQIAAIDVSGFTNNKDLVIVTDKGNRVRWGGQLGAFNPGQVSDQVKAQRLAKLFRDFGRIDADRPLVDLRAESGMLVVDADAPKPTPVQPAAANTKGVKPAAPGNKKPAANRQRAAAER